MPRRLEKTFYADYGRVWEVRVSDLDSVRQLCAKYNGYISTIDFINYDSLSFFYELRCMSKLYWLNIQNTYHFSHFDNIPQNQKITLSFEYYDTTLQYLTSYTVIDSLAPLDSVIGLHLFGFTLPNIDLSRFPSSLNVLSLANCHIESLSMGLQATHPHKLVNINLRGNQLVTFPCFLLELPALSFIELRYNRISSFNCAINQLEMRQLLVEIGGNQIEQLPEIEGVIFKNRE